MPYDASTTRAERWTASGHRRGPLRPTQLRAARTRLSGGVLAKLVQLSDQAILAAIVATIALAPGHSGSTWLPIAASVLAAMALFSFDAYQLGARETLHRHLARIMGAVGGAALLLLILAYFSPPQAKAATTFGIVNWCLPVAALLAASHTGWFFYLRSLRRRGLLTPNLIIVGATPAAERLIIAALGSRDVNILGIFDDRGARAPEHIFGVPTLGKTADVKSHRLLPYVDRIVIAVPSGATARIAQLISGLASVPNLISVLVDTPDPLDERSTHDRLLNMPLAHLAGARRGDVQAIVKRAIDLTLSLFATIMLAPALVAIAVAVLLDSPGPILFKQRRHGYMSEEILVWKFRSMRTEATDHTASRQVTAGDDRVTRIGAFLRRTSLDELPQLWNVIRGEMSLVGPRPHAIGMLSGGDDASKLVETYAHRHRMKPGLTGWAAVNGSRGPVDTAEAVRRRVALDLEYVERQSVWLDLSIIARTLPCVLGDTHSVR